MCSLLTAIFFFTREAGFAKELLAVHQDTLAKLWRHVDTRKSLLKTHLLLQQRATPCQSFWYHISGTEAEYSLLLRFAVSLFLKKGSVKKIN